MLQYVLDDEEDANLDEITGELTEAVAPAGRLESFLVDRLAYALLREGRAARIEASAFDRQGRADPATLDLATRYHRLLGCEISRSLRELRQLRRHPFRAAARSLGPSGTRAGPPPRDADERATEAIWAEALPAGPARATEPAEVLPPAPARASPAGLTPRAAELLAKIIPLPRRDEPAGDPLPAEPGAGNHVGVAPVPSSCGRNEPEAPSAAHGPNEPEMATAADLPNEPDAASLSCEPNEPEPTRTRAERNEPGAEPPPPDRCPPGPGAASPARAPAGPPRSAPRTWFARFQAQQAAASARPALPAGLLPPGPP